MSKTKFVCVTAIGIALFVAMSFVIQVPIFENYYICLGYLVMEVYLYRYGIVSGTIVGTIGVVLYCLLISGLRGMPGWVVGNAMIGFCLGLVFKSTKWRKNWTFYGFCGFEVIIATISGIIFMKSSVESYLYDQHIYARFAKNVYPCIADIAVLLLGLPFCKLLDKRMGKHSNDDLSPHANDPLT